jgi:hypothetical protein
MEDVMLRRRIVTIAFALLLGISVASAGAQGGVPPVIRFSGTVAGGASSARLIFAIYSDAGSETPLWSETQVVALDEAGRYQVLLGSATESGLPRDLFVDGAARWLGVSVEGRREQPPVALVSVPYAMNAANAETIGGKPLSAFVLAGDKSGTGSDGLTYVDTRVLTNAQAPSAGALPPQGGAGMTNGTANYLGLFTDATNLGNSAIYQTPAGRVGVNTTAPQAPFHVMASETPGAFVDVYSGGAVLGALPMVYRAARGTPTTPGAVLTDDILGGLAVRGYNGSAFTGGRGQVMFKAAEDWTTTANGTYLAIATEPIGASAPASERLRILPDGKVGIGLARPMQLLSVAGTIESTLGGFMFPDGTTQFTAASNGVSRVYSGDGISVTGTLSAPIVGASFAGSGGNYGSGNTLARSDHLHDSRYPVLGASGNLALSGTSSPLAMLGVSNSAASIPAVLGTTSSISGIGVSGGANAAGGTGAIGVYGESTAGKGVAGHSPTGYGVYGSTTSGYAGYFAGRVDVNNTSTASGARAFYATTGGADGVAVGGVANNGVGAVGVRGDSASGTAVMGQSTNGYGVYGGATSGRGVGGFATSGYGIFGTATTGLAGRFEGRIQATASVMGGPTLSVANTVSVSGSSAIEGTTAEGDGVKGVATGGGNGLAGYGQGSNAVGAIGYGQGPYSVGVIGDGVDSTAVGVLGRSNDAIGVSGSSTTAVAVDGVSQSSYGGRFQSSTNWAGYFEGSISGKAAYFRGAVQTTGNLAVGGTLTKAGGSFKIDHPLDPENKYLSHSFVESPDMMNIYNGVATLDAAGEAIVMLPEWFQALNRDFRYQLTAVGAPGPGLYIADEVADNRFRIAGGTPGKKVSWQVTGIRHDAYADAHRIVVEEPKANDEQGTYLHPEAFGLPAERGLNAVKDAGSTLPVSATTGQPIKK